MHGGCRLPHLLSSSQTTPSPRARPAVIFLAVAKKNINFPGSRGRPGRQARIFPGSSTELIISHRRRNTPQWAHNRSESLCAGLWVPCRIFLVWFGPALGPTPNRSRRFPAESLNIFGALFGRNNFDVSFHRFFRRRRAPWSGHGQTPWPG